MILNQRIIQLVTEEPNLTSAQIAAKLEKNPKTVKVIMHRLYKTNRVIREKMTREEKSKSGPQNLYVYKAPAVESANAN